MNAVREVRSAAPFASETRTMKSKVTCRRKWTRFSQPRPCSLPREGDEFDARKIRMRMEAHAKDLAVLFLSQAELSIVASLPVGYVGCVERRHAASKDATSPRDLRIAVLQPGASHSRCARASPKFGSRERRNRSRQDHRYKYEAGKARAIHVVADVRLPLGSIPHQESRTAPPVCPRSHR